MWENAFFDEVLDEAIRCDRHLKISQQQEDEDHKIRNFTHHKLQRKLHEATRWITDRSNNGILLLDDALPDGQCF